MTISIIGAGNVAQLLGKSFSQKGHQIVEVYNRSYGKAKTLAKDLSALAVKDIDDLNTDVDIILIAVSDDAIPFVANKLSGLVIDSSIVAHTSGSVPMTSLFKFKNHGVFYPFQTMTAREALDFHNIPILISGNKHSVNHNLYELASSISSKVYSIDDEQRKVIHVAGVFANNFTNHMFVIASDILDSDKIPFEIIQPLIYQTVAKLEHLSPVEGQTGPAIRGDIQTIQSHLELLKSNENYLAIYKLLSKSIIHRNGPEASSNFSQ